MSNAGLVWESGISATWSQWSYEVSVGPSRPACGPRGWKWCHRAGGVRALSPGLITTMPHYSLWIKVVIKHKPHFPNQRPNQTACIQFLHYSPRFVPPFVAFHATAVNKIRNSTTCAARLIHLSQLIYCIFIWMILRICFRSSEHIGSGKWCSGHFFML